MITAKAGVLLSNGVFLQDGNNVKVFCINGDIYEGRIAHFYGDNTGMVLISKANDCLDIIFNEHIKDIQISQ